MIACKIHHLKQRCEERGYSYDEVKDCVVSQEGDELVVDETHPSYPRQKNPTGLGDLVGKGLEFVGITPERVSKAMGRPCGCNKRKQRLNEIGRKLGIGRPKNGHS